MEAVSMVKGQKVDLTKENPGLQLVHAGAGWDVNKGSGNQFDLDLSAVITRNGKVDTKEQLLFFNSPKNSDGKPHIFNGAIVHTGDNLTGVGEGDDETIAVNFQKLAEECADGDNIVFFINIYEADSRKQNFGMVQNAFIRLYNPQDGKELCRFDLSEDHSGSNAMILGRMYLHNGEWKFQSFGRGSNGNINQIVEQVNNNLQDWIANAA